MTIVDYSIIIMFNFPENFENLLYKNKLCMRFEWVKLYAVMEIYQRQADHKVTFIPIFDLLEQPIVACPRLGIYYNNQCSIRTAKSISSCIEHHVMYAKSWARFGIE